MGLETVEVLMECEKTFGVGISDTELEKISSVADLHIAILKEVRKKEPNQNDKEIWFLLVKIIGDIYTIDWQVITPSMTWEELRAHAGDSKGKI